MIDRFGAQAVLGRTIAVREARRMVAAEAIVRGFAERAKSLNWAEWAKDNEAVSTLLILAARLAYSDE